MNFPSVSSEKSFRAFSPWRDLLYARDMEKNCDVLDVVQQIDAAENTRIYFLSLIEAPFTRDVIIFRLGIFQGKEMRAYR